MGYVMQTEANVTINDKEVHGTIKRSITAAVIWIWAMLGMLLAFTVLLIIIPLSIPLHLLLVAFGRRGFAENEDGSIKYNISGNGFRKAE